MGRKSTLARLPTEIRDEIRRLSEEGYTLDEITAELRKMGHAEISRSSTHRWLQDQEEAVEQVRRARIMAEAIAKPLSQNPDTNRVAAANIDLMQSVMMQILTAATRAAKDGENASITMEPMEAMLFAKTLDHLGKAGTADVARTITIEKRADERARKEAAKAVDRAVKQKGLSAETAAAIKAEIFGVKL